MVSWFKAKPVIVREGEMQQLADLLFPPLVTQTNGEDIFQIDYSVDSNLDAALMDLQDGNNDAVTQKTITGVVKRLNKARKILQAYPELDTRAKYLLVDNLDENDVEAGKD